ncbi:MAG: phosphatase PAP2 family protein [Pseudomonadota bacterium]
MRKRLIMQRLRQGISHDFDPCGAQPQVQVNLKGDGCDPIVRPTTEALTSPAEIGAVLGHARLRYEREAEIHVQMTEIIPFFGAVVNLRGDRHKYTWELLDCVVDTTIEAHMPVKAMLGVKRPADIDPHVQPMLPDPGHASFPSGHATESYAISGVLHSLLKSASAFNSDFHKEAERQFERIAQRISVNRIVAGLHFPADNCAGEKLGRAVASHVTTMCADPAAETIEASLWAKAVAEWA